jgi:adenosylcobyric acid synthase
MTARTLMIQGSSSSVGKSLLVTALCRIYARRGHKVAPFKAQNMSNNAAVCPDGSEIGRAQALQALASGIELCSDLNPILIKPEADMHSQVILNGRPFKSMSAMHYYTFKKMLWEHATAALDRLRAQFDLVIIEGAGSPAELNLKAGDIVNMAIARHADSPVLLAGDIDRGGIFAQLLGTLWLLEPEERQLVRGFLVNKFRGDMRLFEDGIRILEEKSGIPVLGVIPYLKDLNLPDEDAVSVEVASLSARPASASQIDIAVLAFPRIANSDDFDSLRAEPGVHLRHVTSARELGAPHAIILPGTKSTMADLGWMRQTGLADAVIRFAEHGGEVVGICGGYQMLGQVIHDPSHVESKDDSMKGLGLLPIVTNFAEQKETHRIRARVLNFRSLEDEIIDGYEIHMGETQSQTPWLEITHRNGQSVKVKDGSVSSDGKVWGCYLHGLFHNDSVRHAWLRSLDWKETGISQTEDFSRSLDALADAVERSLDVEKLEKIIWGD